MPIISTKIQELFEIGINPSVLYTLNFAFEANYESPIKSTTF